jgi:hypothetical protein
VIPPVPGRDSNVDHDRSMADGDAQVEARRGVIGIS